MTFRLALLVGAAAGFLAVVAGTFGAHGLEGRIDADLLQTYEVGVRYHAYHALALLCSALLIERGYAQVRASAWCFAAGIVVFSGSLYLLAFTGLRWLGAITPIGGVLFLVGWGNLLVVALRMGRESINRSSDH